MGMRVFVWVNRDVGVNGVVDGNVNVGVDGGCG